MAQKFGNARWVREGYFDNRADGIVVGQITFAALGMVDFCLSGNLTGEIAGKVVRFHNRKFLEDPYAGELLEGFAIPHIGKVSLFSFDPHPLLSPHPYFEWFSDDQQHYRIELEPDDAWLLNETDWGSVSEESQRIRQNLEPCLHSSSS